MNTQSPEWMYIRAVARRSGAGLLSIPSLFDPDLKRQWAKKHLDDLTLEARLIQDLNTPQISSEEDLEHGWYVIRIKHIHDERISQAALLVGDFISCLRSCLDHLVWQLALFGNPDPRNKYLFPYYREGLLGYTSQDCQGYIWNA